MTLPETIPVKYTEEEAEYLSVRPVVRQTFRITELVDMILAVTGKDPARVQQILRSGTAVFHFYRYWWAGFEAGDEELARLLEKFPDPWPARPFVFSECDAIHLEPASGRAGLKIAKDAASRRNFLRRQSLWDCLAEWAARNAPRYELYSYEQHADVFAIEVDADEWPALRKSVLHAAPRGLRRSLNALPEVRRVLCFCPRP